MAKDTENNEARYFLIIERPYDGRSIYGSISTIGMFVEPPGFRNKRYTVDWNKIGYIPDRYNRFIFTKEIPQAEYENRELFEVTPVLPLIPEDAISQIIRKFI